MKLYEYQAKNIFASHEIIVPEGQVVNSAQKAAEVAEKLKSVVLKPQLSVKGRGKVGAVLFAKDSGEAEKNAEKLLAMTVKGEKVERILVEKKADIEKEYYMSVVVDYSARKPVAMASVHGGVDIEEVARKHPEEIIRAEISIEKGLEAFFLREIESRLGQGSAKIMEKLYRVFRECDAEMVEINPIVLDKNGQLIAVDAVLNVNDDSLFRQPEIFELKKESANSLEERARAENWTYIELGGNIGILSSGAGITMTILDLLDKGGVKPANFLDTAQMDSEGLYKAFDLLLENEKVEVVLVNIFAGLNRCDDLAEGIKHFVKERKPSQPLVVRMIGNREKEGFRTLEEIGIEPIKSLEQAIARTVYLAGGKK